MNRKEKRRNAKNNKNVVENKQEYDFYSDFKLEDDKNIVPKKNEDNISFDNEKKFDDNIDTFYGDYSQNNMTDNSNNDLNDINNDYNNNNMGNNNINDNQNINANMNNDYNQNINNNMNNNSNSNMSYSYQEKEYKTGTLEENTVVTKTSKVSRVFLYSFYLIFVVIAIVVFFILRADRYEFYLKKDEVTLSVGSTYQVELTPKNIRYFDYLNYDYKMSDEKIATVDEFGTVTAVGTGTTTLKISLSPGFTSKTMKINTEALTIESVKLAVDMDGNLNTDSVVNMDLNQTIALKAIINSREDINTSINYGSSDPNVATVDEFGYVTSKKVGTTTITGEKNGVTGTIVIRVEKQTSPSEQPAKVIQSVSFASGSVALKKGNKTQLTLIVMPNELSNSPMTWTSSNTNVVKVDNKGVVTGVNNGQAIIKVTSSNGKTATCEVKVSGDDIKINSIKLNSSNKKIVVGDLLQLKTTISPENATIRNLTWTSSNTKVATVNNGLVTGISQGTATITVKSSDGKATASCTITVDKKPAVTPSPNNSTKVSSVTIMPSSTITRYVGESILLSKAITPSTAKASNVTWTSSNMLVATVDANGIVKALKKGTTVITVNVDGVTATTTVIVKEQPTTPIVTATPTIAPVVTSTPTIAPAATPPAGNAFSASEVTITPLNLTIEQGKTATFTIKVNNAAGLLSIWSRNTKVATVTLASADCNESKCFFDNNSMTITVTGVAPGTTTININDLDLVSYDEKKIIGSGSIGILVK